MVASQIEARGITTPGVLAALRAVPRHEFVSASQAPVAYHDSALPIGHGQTISQPYIVGVMTELTRIHPGQSVLEIGTGSGYQAAALAEIGARVHTVEIVAYQAERAAATLARLGYSDRVTVHLGDGFLGWPAAAPYDSILVTCAATDTPAPLLTQLAPHGRLILPLGDSLSFQTLTVVTKDPDGQPVFQDVMGVVFVPMTGPHAFKPPE
jgi:protein-L-isoaspartate(D-aspartate) O-methyltransferase